ncbi:hypothetical protein TNCV_3548751 [Trichonephila clavipes]|nr:hypothetical protein TNCV_3548751 [Trichonephila clavipes]
MENIPITQYRSLCAAEEFHSDASLKQWTNKHRTPQNTGSGQRKLMSVREDRHLLCLAKKDRTTSSKQLAARWSTATGVSFVNSSTSAAPWIGWQG